MSSRFIVKSPEQMVLGEPCAPWEESAGHWPVHRACDDLNFQAAHKLRMSSWAWKCWNGFAIGDKKKAGYCIVDLHDNWHMKVDDEVLAEEFGKIQRSESTRLEANINGKVFTLLDMKAAWSRELRKRVEDSDKARKQSNVVYGPIDDLE